MVVAKPNPEEVNLRDFQILQVIRRFSPQRQDEQDGTHLEFVLRPSDPDFPFELDGLQCELTVPPAWPTNGRPRLRIKNNEIPRGYQINIENGFGGLVLPNRTLLASLNELDKHLERFLTAEKAPTVKIIANTDRSGTSTPHGQQVASPETRKESSAAVPASVTPTYSPEQLQEARSKRDADIRQLEARLNRVALFSKSADGTTFIVPIQIPKAGRLPAGLREVKEVSLFVPPLYNLEPCSIKLKGISGVEVKNVEMAFERRAQEEPAQTLMAHVNYLTQHMHSMATEAASHSVLAVVRPEPLTQQQPVKDAGTTADPQEERKEQVFDQERPHIKVIPRPPEWDRPADDSDDDSSDIDDSAGETSASEEDVDQDHAGGASLPVTATVASATGNSIIILFPSIELYGIELLELTSLALTLRCDRCKSTADVKNLRAGSLDSTTSVTVTEACPKCAQSLAASYQAEPMHANSTKAGHLDLTSCTIVDMLPSTFKPTCSDCSTAVPTPPGVISVRGETTLAVCRSCHRKMTFKIPEVKFLRVAAHASGVPLPPRKRKVKENLGIVAGTPLPNLGKCSHYRKSHRWFRFSCCNKVYPCDRCHDEQSEPKHPNEHANRMLCGYCSREQNYRPEDCGICGRSLIGRRGTGFWEGGTGTRDKTKMSRKDPRKYKRRGGTVPRGA